MTRASSPKPSLVPAILALVVLVLFGYLLFTDLADPKHTEHNVNPPIEIIDQPPPLTVITPSDTAASNEEIVEQEAEAFVQNLAEKSPQIDITITEDNDQFVRHDSTILLPDLEQRTTTIQQLINDSSLSATTPLTLHYTTTQLSETTLAQLGDSIEDHTEAITIITKDGQQISKPLADLLNQLDADEIITLVTYTKHSKKITIGELTNSGIDLSQTVTATINHGIQKLTIKEIIQSSDMPDSALFYLHRVSNHDQQGLWGIIQAGLINKFREGLRIEGISRSKDLIQVTIPSDADERLTSGLSSFLGKILNHKVDSSYIYNFNTQSMGRDPNIIHPGQQLIMIHFSSDELKQIYQFFSDKRNQGIETFAITH